MRTILVFALIVYTIPAVAFGQAADCEGCTHQVPIYMGAGGLIATAADDAEMVNWRSTCGNVTRTGSEMPDDGGVVSMSLGGDLACDDEDGTFELGPIMDGGWFWMHRGDYSGIGNLVADAVMDNEMTEITMHDSVMVTAGAGVSLVMHDSGRFGILPNILPEPPAEDPVVEICGPRITPNASPPIWTSQRSTSCMLGDGGTKIQITGPVAAGRHGPITTGMVTRPATGVDPLNLAVTLWVNESGSFNPGLDPTSSLPADVAYQGWLGKGEGAPHGNWLRYIGWFVALADTHPGANPDLAAAGVTLTANVGGQGRSQITISPSATYCPSEGTQTTATVIIMAWRPNATVPVSVYGGGTATGSAANTDNIRPRLATQPSLGGAYAATELRIVCLPPASSANMGPELLPENPFPTDR